MTSLERIKSFIRWGFRHGFDKKNRKRLINKKFTILSSNCTGGVIYHALGVKFYSPTINLYFSAPDFIKFVKNPSKYIFGNMSLLDTTKYAYPVIKCEDIIIYAVHYKSFEEFRNKWIKRSKRIDWNNCYIIMTERDNCTLNDIEEFDKLPYKNKVIFVHEQMPEIKSAYYIEGTEIENNTEHKVKALTDYVGKVSGIRYIDKFDYVSFLNNGELHSVIYREE